jgi:glycine/D-amino acid oxidase-like deaminating enzyme
MAGSDVVIVGGGIIGTACAYELARSGASVTLLERDELAAGASGRNIGFFGLPWDPVLDPMATSSLQMYLEVTSDPPVPVHFDREPIGTLAVAIDEDDAAMVREEAAAAGRAGLRAERLDAAGLKELEPEVTADVSEAWLFHEGRRVDPGALTLALGELARRAGASIRHHLPGRRLLSRGESVTGVATDDGVIESDTVVLAAGPVVDRSAPAPRHPHPGDRGAGMAHPARAAPTVALPLGGGLGADALASRGRARHHARVLRGRRPR